MKRVQCVVFLMIMPLTFSCGKVELEADEPITERSSAVMCGGESRNSVTALTFPNGAVGKVFSPTETCTGTIIAPNKIMTAAHCLESVASPLSIAFRPQFGIVTQNAGPSSSSAIRITQGRDAGDQPQYADWAIVTFSTDFRAQLTQLGLPYQQMSRVIPGSVPFSATLVGYGKMDGPGTGDFTQRPGQETCSVDAFLSSDNQTLLHTCDVTDGDSGGPIFAVSGSTAQLLAIQSGHGGGGTCTGQSGNNAANGKWYSFAPDNAGGVAMARAGDGHLIAYASDLDWTLIATRQKQSTDANASWTEWQSHSSSFSGGHKVAAVNLTDNRQQVFVVDGSGNIQTHNQLTVDGSWSGWGPMGNPVAVKDIVATGGSGVTTHVFILGTDNSVRVAFKTGGASSAWSSWNTLGTLSGATSLSAVFFGGIHQVFVGTSAGAFSTWGSGTGFGFFSGFDNPGSGVVSIGAGLLADGRVNVMAFNGSNQLMMRIRSSAGSWTAWTSMPQANPLRVVNMNTVTMGRLTDGRAQVLAIGSEGNIYQMSEGSPASFGSWSRFYK